MTDHPVRLRRVYDPPEAGDGMRVLIDRLWPRGMTKAKAAVDIWLKELAPSNELRKRFGHDPAKWADFEADYRAEIAADPGPLAKLRALRREGGDNAALCGA
jgi:uncharacterized protein YeaO (DUF488 family)